MIGQTISHFRVLEKLGEGGMGEVYLAEDTSLDRKVALKFLPPRLQDDEIAHRRFLREAKSAAALDHPFICNIYEVSQTNDGHDFICMEYVEGLTLQDKLAEGPLPLRDALQIGVEVAQALEKAHSAGIVHRDLKPSNIMLTTDGHPKVMDFGLAKKVVREDGTEQDISSALTREGAILGTLAYMSPEQIKGESVDHRSDIFSFGIVLYEMLTGVHPFRKAQGAETTAAILDHEPAQLARFIEDIPELLQHTIRKMLAKDTGERYQSAHEVRTNLTELSVEITRPLAAAVPERKRPPWVPVVLGLVGLVLAVLLAYWGIDMLRQPVPPVERVGKSIAVLPLENLSPDPENEYFADGITEDITTELSKIGDLKVIGRTSAMRFKGSDKSLNEIAEELGVATLLQGSVRKANERVRIVAQLIDAETDKNLWAETYDRDLTDIFEIQSDVAQQIAAALKVELSLAEKSQIEKKPTENMQAYNLYMMGRHFRNRENTENLKRAVDYYEQAIREDPDFAEAYAWLADASYLLGYFYEPDGEWTTEKAEAEVQRALELDETIAAAHVTRGNLLGYLHRDFAGAEREYKRALELDPSHVNAHREYGLFLLLQRGVLDAALVQLRRAHELDPLSLRVNGNLAGAHLATAEVGKVAEILGRVRELSPDSKSVNTGQVYLVIAEYDKAELEAKKAFRINPNSHFAEWLLAQTYLCQGRMAQASEVSRRRLSAAPNYQHWAVAGVVALWAGNHTEARSFLEKAVELKPTGLSPYWPATWRYSTALAYILWKSGDHEEAEEILSENLRLDDPQRIESGAETATPSRLYDIAMVYAIRGEKQAAYRWLQKAIDAGWRYYGITSQDPIWADFHGDERFRKMMAEVKAKVEVMRLRVREMEKEWDK